MAYRTESIFPLDPIAATLGKAWHWLMNRPLNQAMGRWSLMYIDPNGDLQRAVVDVIGVRRGERIIFVRSGPQKKPVAIKASRVVEAIDVPTGRRVLMDRWFAHLARR